MTVKLESHSLNLAALTWQMENGTSPLMGVPIRSDGRGRPAVFRRKHLRAALNVPGHLKAFYDMDTGTLTVNGGRSYYVLNDLVAQGKLFPWQVKDKLVAWAKGRRKTMECRKLAQAAGPAYPAVMRTREQIAKLERKRAKTYLQPWRCELVPRDYEREPAGEHERTQELAWREEKNIRHKLGAFAARGKQGTWTKFYAECERITNRHVDSGQKYAAIRQRRSSYNLTWNEYWRALPEWLGLARKPRREPEKWDQQAVAERRREYSAQLLAMRATDEELTKLRALLASYEQQSEGVHQ